MKTKTLTTEVEILRDGLEKAQAALDDARDYHTHESRETLLLSEIEKINRAFEQADEAGPTDEDKKRLKATIQTHLQNNHDRIRMFDKYCTQCWTLSELRHTWGIE